MILVLSAHGLRCGEVTYVIGTHGHSDHIGNLNLFTNATHIVCHDINKGNTYQSHPFNEVINYYERIPTICKEMQGALDNP